MKTLNFIFPAIIMVLFSLFIFSYFVTSPQTVRLSLSENSNNDSGTGIKKISLSEKFPAAIQQWGAFIEKSAGDHNLNPNLIAAVIMQESGGDAKAYSSSGAVGLMQVMPQDGIAADFMCGENPCFRNRPTIMELNEPAFNIEYGARLLEYLHNQCSNWRTALKAYGPMEVDFNYADLVLQIFNDHQIP